jgi:hypothetical protein
MTRFDQLQSLLARTPLAWSSESDFPIEAVTVNWRDAWGMEVVKDPKQLLKAQLAGWGEPGKLLYNALVGYTLRGFYRIYGPSEWELYLLTKDGNGIWTGIKTRVVRT